MWPRLRPLIFSWVNRQGRRCRTSWDSRLDLARISTFFGSGVYLMTVDCRGMLSQFEVGWLRWFKFRW
jgi:hypothetical protein